MRDLRLVALLVANIAAPLTASEGILEKAATVETLNSYSSVVADLGLQSAELTNCILGYASTNFGQTYPLFAYGNGLDVLVEFTEQGLIWNGALRPAEQLLLLGDGGPLTTVFFQLWFKAQLLNCIEHESSLLTNMAFKMGLKALLQQSAMSSSAFLASKCWGGSGTYNGDALQKGMRENIKSNIHQVGLVGGGYVVTTPSKNIVYHTYIKSVDDLYCKIR